MTKHSFTLIEVGIATALMSVIFFLIFSFLPLANSLTEEVVSTAYARIEGEIVMDAFMQEMQRKEMVGGVMHDSWNDRIDDLTEGRPSHGSLFTDSFVFTNDNNKSADLFLKAGRALGSIYRNPANTNKFFIERTTEISSGQDPVKDFQGVMILWYETGEVLSNIDLGSSNPSIIIDKSEAVTLMGELSYPADLPYADRRKIVISKYISKKR